MTNEKLGPNDYRDAINVQDACNLSGVVKHFADVMSRIWETARETGNENTNWVNTHPIAIMYANKIADLTGQHVDIVTPFSKAYQICKAEQENEKNI